MVHQSLGHRSRLDLSRQASHTAVTSTNFDNRKTFASTPPEETDLPQSTDRCAAIGAPLMGRLSNLTPIQRRVLGLPERLEAIPGVRRRVSDDVGGDVE